MSDRLASLCHRVSHERHRTPLSGYWGKFKEAYYVMEAEHVELGRMVKDNAALGAVAKLKTFSVTSAISRTYRYLIDEHSAEGMPDKRKFQRDELVAIAEQEQLNVLQPLIYNDPLLKVTMDTNHRFSRLTNGWLSPKFQVIYSAAAINSPPIWKLFSMRPTR